MKVLEYKLHQLGASATSCAFDLRVQKDEAINNIVHHLMTQVIRQCQHSDEVKLEVRLPATWWQHFKFSCAPNWFIKKFPVRQIVITKLYKMDLEVIALPDYEYIKKIAAHSPFIRVCASEPRQFQPFYSDTGEFATKIDMAPIQMEGKELQ